MIDGLIWLVCAALYYTIILPVRFVVRTTMILFLTVCCASGAYIVGSFAYGVYLGVSGQ